MQFAATIKMPDSLYGMHKNGFDFFIEKGASGWSNAMLNAKNRKCIVVKKI